jgi:hypothetical protein
MAAVVLIGGVTVTTYDGEYTKVRDFHLSEAIFNSVLRMLDPGSMGLGLMEGVIYLTVGTDGNDYAELVRNPGNKPGDILVWLGLSDEARERSFRVFADADVVDDATAISAARFTKSTIACIVFTYLLHGSLKEMLSPKNQVLTFAVLATGIEKESMTRERVTNFADLGSLKMGTLVTNCIELLEHASDTLKSRCRLGFAGNRMLSVIALLKRARPEYIPTVPLIALLWEDTVIGGIPYVSLHPDHPLNPMADMSKNLHAAVGDAYRVAKYGVAEANLAEPGLFLKQTIMAMGKKFNATTMPLPSVERMVGVLDEDHSVSYNYPPR